MPVNGNDLFNRVRALWPHSIILKSDGPWNEGDPIWTVVGIYEEIEGRLSGDGDDWIQLAAWAFHQALFDQAKQKLVAGQYALRPDEISFEAFDRRMRKNLSDDSWAHIRKEYGR